MESAITTTTNTGTRTIHIPDDGCDDCHANAELCLWDEWECDFDPIPAPLEQLWEELRRRGIE